MIQICITGWHFDKKRYRFFQEINETFPVYVVAHAKDEDGYADAYHFLNPLGFKYDITPNIGLEFHCYDYFLHKFWDKKSDVIFMHDDLVFSPILKNNEIITPMVSFNKIPFLFSKYDQCYIFQSEEDARWNAMKHGRIFTMTGKLCQWFLDYQMGFKYDTKNTGQTSPGCDINYNNGIEWFDNDLLKARKDGLKVKNIALVSNIETLRRSMTHNDFLGKYGRFYQY